MKPSLIAMLFIGLLLCGSLIACNYNSDKSLQNQIQDKNDSLKEIRDSLKEEYKQNIAKYVTVYLGDEYKSIVLENNTDYTLESVTIQYTIEEGVFDLDGGISKTYTFTYIPAKTKKELNIHTDLDILGDYFFGLNPRIISIKCSVLGLQ